MTKLEEIHASLDQESPAITSKTFPHAYTTSIGSGNNIDAQGEWTKEVQETYGKPDETRVDEDSVSWHRYRCKNINLVFHTQLCHTV